MYFFKGIIVGFLIAAPVGPVGLLCIRRALADGRGAAFIAGLGAAVADTFYGAIAGLGVSLASEFLRQYQVILSFVGGSVLIALGIHAWRTPLYLGEMSVNRLGILRDFTMTFLITLTNPMTVFAFMAVFATFGAAPVADDMMMAALLISGVFIGSSLWWLGLSAIAGSVRRHLSVDWLRKMHRLSAGLLITLGGGVLVCMVFF